ncbi:MAG: helicase-exonuclease AddAB subunit AddA [bacterium]|nr:helicase-exonuclease AddAB subunit AddA [bacterium]
MGVKWTPNQQQIIEHRNGNLLVSAAAGSGKTAVLVERIIQKILDPDHPVDIDRMLVVTFTKAAAAQMRERVSQALEKCMDAEPDNPYLQRQYTLVHHAQITTIDSFCLYIVKNYFHVIDLEPGFRVGDPGELSLIGQDVLSEVLEKLYEAQDENFLAFSDSYSNAKNDNPIVEMVSQLYEYAQSAPWPLEWLEGLGDSYDEQALDLSNLKSSNSWLSQLVEELKHIIGSYKDQLLQAKELCLLPDGPDMYLETIEAIIEQMNHFEDIEDFDELGFALKNLDFGRLKVRKNFEGDKKVQELVKKIREDAKKKLDAIYKESFALPLQDQLQDMRLVGKAVKTLARVTRAYTIAFSEKKREKKLLDFSDIEHMALQILVDPITKEPSAIAHEFRDCFDEIMIDEYQDSNYVQEEILTAIAGKDGRENRFMVGDVKQSIYRFRLARPELFIEKYDSYTEKMSRNRKICLDQNFRSRTNVLDSVNALFYRIMKRDVGGVTYDAAAALYPGASYPQCGADDFFKTRLLLADSGKEAREISGAESNNQQEAIIIAEEIHRLLADGRVTGEDGTLRPVRLSDIVILLRSPSGWGDELSSTLMDYGIPSHQLSQKGYFSATEVQTVLAMCHVIDNPLQDIPLAAAARSAFFGFTNEELARIRTASEKVLFYDCMTEYAAGGALEPLREKTAHMLSVIDDYREKSRHLPVHTILEQLMQENHYLMYVSALPAGKKRAANLAMLIEQAVAFERTSYRGLFHFIRYMEQLQEYEVDFGEADVIGESEDVVRIMSIHKSKGLEFPIVFVAGLGREFNKKDSQKQMILDYEYGVGLTCIEGEKRRKKTTLLKKMMSMRIAAENMGEELRVLYVAMTRAKEQLILTAASKNIDTVLMTAELKKESNVSYLDRAGATGYLQWVLPCALANPEYFAVEIYRAEDFHIQDELKITENLVQKDLFLQSVDDADELIVQELDEKLTWPYPYEEEVMLRTKVSVSELKHRAMQIDPMEEQSLEWYARPTEKTLAAAKFLQTEEERQADNYQGALRGSAMHRMMEYLNYEMDLSAVNETQIQNQLEQLQQDGKMSEEYASLVNCEKIARFMKTPLAGRIARADRDEKLFREQPFVMGLPANETDATIQSEELVLVQGIIDLYFEDTDGQLVLLDYKTDAVSEAKQLIERYQTQMNLYAKALEKATGKRVKEKFIYAFRLDQSIQL